MHKPAKYFLIAVFLLVGSLTLMLLYYGGTSGKQTAVITPDVVTQKVDSQKLEADYRVKTKAIIAEVASAAEAPASERAGRASKAKTELLTLTVPSQFKDLHLELVLAADKLLNFFKSGTETEKLASQDLIKQAKNKYDWLN